MRAVTTIAISGTKPTNANAPTADAARSDMTAIKPPMIMTGVRCAPSRRRHSEIPLITKPTPTAKTIRVRINAPTKGNALPQTTTRLSNTNAP